MDQKQLLKTVYRITKHSDSEFFLLDDVLQSDFVHLDNKRELDKALNNLSQMGIIELAQTMGEQPHIDKGDSDIPIFISLTQKGIKEVKKDFPTFNNNDNDNELPKLSGSHLPKNERQQVPRMAPQKIDGSHASGHEMDKESESNFLAGLVKVVILVLLFISTYVFLVNIGVLS